MSIINNIFRERDKIQLRAKKAALREAKRIAYILADRFGAKEVVLYGSLAKKRYFDAASDIDIAVRGLGDKYLKAYGYCLGLSRFNLDIKVYEDMPDSFKSRVDKQGRLLYAEK